LINIGTPTDYPYKRYRKLPVLVRMRASQLRQAIIALVSTSEETGMSFMFERARRCFEATFH
jgi:hypothetical protein